MTPERRATDGRASLDADARAGVLAVGLVALVAVLAAFLPWERFSDPIPARDTVVPADLLRPEPAERGGFVLAAVAACLLPWLLTPVLVLAGQVRRDCLRVAGCLALLLAGATSLARPLFLDAGGLGISPVLPLAAVGLVAWLGAGPSGPVAREAIRPLASFGRISAVAGGVVVVSLSFVGGLLDERALSSRGWAHTHHLASVLGPVAEAASGKTVLVDLEPTYGAYAQLLAPLAAFVGPGLLPLSTLFALLRVASLLATWAALRRMTRRRGVAGLTVLAVGGWQLFTRVSAASGPEGGPYDPYLQYHPVRTLFPAVGLWILARYVQERRPLDRALLLVLCPLAVVWNPDSGLAVSAFVVVGLALSSPRSSLRVLAGWGFAVLAAVACGCVAYSAFACVRTGVLAEPWALFDTARFYVRSGYMLLPIPLWHPWLAVAAAYVGTLGIVAQRRMSARLGATSSFLGATAALGIGLLLYYQGRSHDWNLPSVTLPVLVIGGVFLDRTLDVLSEGGDVAVRIRPSASLLIAVPLLGALAFVQGLGPLVGLGARRLVGDGTAGSVDTRAQAVFLKEKAQGDPRPLVLSHFAWILHWRAGTSTPLRRAALAEFLEYRELDGLRHLLGPTGVDRVFVARDDPFSFFREEVAERLRTLLRVGFQPEATSGDGGLVLWTRKPPGTKPPDGLAPGPVGSADVIPARSR